MKIGNINISYEGEDIIIRISPNKPNKESEWADIPLEPSEPPTAPKNRVSSRALTIPEQITTYCDSKEKETGVNEKELKRFKAFYMKLAPTWKGKRFDGDTLFTKWMKTSKQ